MKDILEEIIAWKRKELEQQKYDLPAKELYAIVDRIMSNGIEQHSMHESLENSPYGIIAEFKRKSPSKGWIKEEGRADVIPASYAQNGASAISILTDEKFFGGNLDFIKKSRPTVDIPILRKDFIIDEYQLFQALPQNASPARPPVPIGVLYRQVILPVQQQDWKQSTTQRQLRCVELETVGIRL